MTATHITINGVPANDTQLAGIKADLGLGSAAEADAADFDAAGAASTAAAAAAAASLAKTSNLSDLADKDAAWTNLGAEARVLAQLLTGLDVTNQGTPASTSTLVQALGFLAAGKGLAESALGAATVGRPTRCYVGDSITQYAVTPGLPITSTGGTGFGSAQWVAMYAEWDCEGGAGTLTYNATAKTLQWTPLAGTAGPTVDASYTGIIKCPGGVAGHGIWVGWYGGTGGIAYTSGTATVTVSGAGTQVWMYPNPAQGGYVQWAQAYGQQAHRLAPLPAPLPPGADGIYGIGGATAADLVRAIPQWSTIGADSYVFQCGTNDFAGSVSVSAFVANVQTLVQAAWAKGARYCRWLTITPRNSDTSTQRQRKAAAAQQLYDWGLTTKGRFEVLDVAAPVTQVASGATQGQWLTGYTLDGIHPNNAGGAAIGRVIGLADLRLANQGVYLGAIGDVWSSTENPNGNILNAVSAGSGLMEGVGGTITSPAIAVAAWAATTAAVVDQPCIAGGRLYVCTAAGTTGSTAPTHTAGRAVDGSVTWEFQASGAVAGLATGWQITRQVGAAMGVAVCKLPRTDGVPGEWQRVFLWGASSNEAARLITSQVSTGVATGGLYTLNTEFRHVASVSLNCLGNQIGVSGTGGAKLSQWGIAATSSAYGFADAVADPNRVLVTETPPSWVVTSASVNMYVTLHLGTKNGGSAIIDFGRTRLRRVA